MKTNSVFTDDCLFHRLLANLTQPLEVFVQLGVPLGQQCQREINTLVSRAKTCCTNLDFFKNLHGRMETALFRVSSPLQSDPYVGLVWFGHK